MRPDFVRQEIADKRAEYTPSAGLTRGQRETARVRAIMPATGVAALCRTIVAQLSYREYVLRRLRRPGHRQFGRRALTGQPDPRGSVAL